MRLFLIRKKNNFKSDGSINNAIKETQDIIGLNYKLF